MRSQKQNLKKLRTKKSTTNYSLAENDVFSIHDTGIYLLSITNYNNLINSKLSSEQRQRKQKEKAFDFGIGFFIERKIEIKAKVTNNSPKKNPDSIALATFCDSPFIRGSGHVSEDEEY